MYNCIFYYNIMYFGILPNISPNPDDDYYNDEFTHRMTAEEIGQLMGGN